jgi:hypothetical protein
MKLGPKEPYNPNNPEHLDPTKYKLYEGTVYDHTIQALKELKVIDPISALSVLLHDVGKPATQTIDNGKIHYLEHAKVGADIIDKIADRLKLDNPTRQALIFTVLNHMKFHDLLGLNNSTVYKMMGNENWNTLINVAYCDAKSRLHLFNQQEWDKIVIRIKELTEKFQSKNAIDRVKKVVNGQWIMQLKNVKPGPIIGKYINQTVDWILNNNIDIADTKKIEDYIRGL